jgi:Lrp/AsnC family transcriptional regulator, leucine-responsive regulatory protein
MELDGVDRAILRLLQQNARISNAEIARQVEMAPSAVLERVRKLEDRGVIGGYHARVSPRALGYGLTAFVFVRAEESLGAAGTAEQLRAMPEALEVHHVAGEDCFLVKVRTEDTESLGRFLRERLGPVETVRSTRTTIVLETVKETDELVVPEVRGTGGV